MPERALVTGATSGIGLEISRELARRRYDLVLVARREVELERIASELRAVTGDVRYVRCDLGESHAPCALRDELDRRDLAIDVLVNNAGRGCYGRFDLQDIEDILAVVQLNVVALTHLTRLLVPGMVDRGHGTVMNIGSLAGFQPGPLQSVYHATKAYVLSFSEGLQRELRGTGVHVMDYCPGFTSTGFGAVAGVAPSRVMGRISDDPRSVGRAAVRAMRRRRVVVVHGIRYKLVAQITRVVPRFVVREVAYRVLSIGRTANR